MLRNNLKTCREGRGLSQAELAQAARITAATVAQIERGEEVIISTKAAASIAEVLGVQPSKIFS